MNQAISEKKKNETKKENRVNGDSWRMSQIYVYMS